MDYVLRLGSVFLVKIHFPPIALVMTYLQVQVPQFTPLTETSIFANNIRTWYILLTCLSTDPLRGLKGS